MWGNVLKFFLLEIMIMEQKNGVAIMMRGLARSNTEIYRAKP